MASGVALILTGLRQPFHFRQPSGHDIEDAGSNWYSKGLDFEAKSPVGLEDVQ